MLYDIINPSDPYTMIANDIELAAIVLILLGDGKYGGEPIGEEGESIPILASGDADKWFHDNFQRSMEDSFQLNMNNRLQEIIDIFDSILIGSAKDRTLFFDAISKMSQEDAKKFREQWCDKKRSSMNDIGLKAQRYFNHLTELQQKGASK